MKVFLTGASGFIGRHVLFALSRGGHEITCLVREPAAPALESLALPGVAVRTAAFTQVQDWGALVRGHDVVVNTVGIIRETPRGSFDDVHRRAPVALFGATRQAGVRKIVQLSALGAEDGAVSRYHQTKRAADAYLESLGVPFIVLKPSLVYGPGDHSMALFSALAALPITPVPGDGRYEVQPVHVDDLVRAIVRAVEDDGIARVSVDVGGERAYPFREVLDILARWSGKPRGATKLPIPLLAMRAAAMLTDAFGGRGPITQEELGMLLLGSTCDIEPFARIFGFRPLAFAAGVARRPRSPEALWYARLRNLILPLRLSIAFVWLATGFICAFVYPLSGSLALMARVGIEGALAHVSLYGICLIEIALGVATAIGWRVRALGAVQLALMLAFMVMLTAGMPELWWHPFGPLTKNIPLIAATLVMMATAER
ncbi:MAG: NAD(P)H-binding protein [Candidatus Schekmanbacteria bacterium]|nr:NAD(P)H-binding protein [Candidatus Schekmanbacteria bacterium]